MTYDGKLWKNLILAHLGDYVKIEKELERDAVLVINRDKMVKMYDAK